MSEDFAFNADALFANDTPAAPTPAPEPAQQMQPVPSDQTSQNSLLAEAANVLNPAPEPAQNAQTVPLHTLIETRKRAQAAEQERSQIAAQNAQLIEAIQRLTASQQAPREPHPAQQVIDPIADPEGAYAALQAQMRDGMLNMHLNMSERYARQAHTDEVVNEAFEAAVKSGYAEHFKNRPDPYGEMVQWHKGQKMAQEIGTDPAAYRAKLEAEIRTQLLANLKAGQPTPQTLPPSLAGSANAAQATPAAAFGSDKDFFRQTLNPRRAQ